MRPLPRAPTALTALAALAASTAGGLALALSWVAWAGQAHDDEPAPVSPVTLTATAMPWTPAAAPPAVPDDLTVTVAFGGDILTHMPVNASAAAAAGAEGGYEFNPLLAGADAWIAGADLAICQLEVPLAPPGRAPTGFPIFAAPSSLARDLAEAGWDGCTTASNHAIDQGWAGVSHTIETLLANGMGYAGTALDADDAELAQLYRLTGAGQTLTIAHIAATYGTNGLPLPAAQPWAVNTPIDTDRLIAQAEAARAAGAEVVLASVHAGVEYQTTPSAEQRAIVSRLAESGQIDAVIGDHPHVAQPVELVPGGVHGDGMWVVYSLGNFISNQTDAVVGPNTDTGAVAFVTIAKDAGGAAVTGMTWAGVTVDSAHGHRVHMLEDAVDGELGQIGAAGVKLRHDRLRAIMGSAPEQLAPPTPSGATLEVLPRSG
ncbi:MAG: CapA family protein [Bifidobacteriaceae bacterium]|jgi:poly-gamma-glutamate synthesis protein (capsule biosynthesis protein)|nr:CapA family protein [Bifidobacteriaceae bacterium]